MNDGLRQPPTPPFLFPVPTPNKAFQNPTTVVPAGGQGIGPPGMGSPPADVRQPGGDLLNAFQHPAWTTLEQLYRVLPEDAWFSPLVSPSSPITFELGAFTVPVNQQFWLYNYEFKVYRQSGFDAGDIVPAEEGRFGGVLGFDVNVDGRRSSNLLYQLDPVPVQVQPQTYDRPPGHRANEAQFNRSAAQSFAANATPGLSLLPVRREHQGNNPFTIIAEQQGRVSLSCVIFKPIPAPVTAIEGRMTGYLIHTSIGEALRQRVRPK